MPFLEKTIITFLIFKKILDLEHKESAFLLFAEKLISLSYFGDVRTYFGIDNGDKYRKILMGNETIFRELYASQFNLLTSLDKNGGLENYISHCGISKLECFRNVEIGKHSAHEIAQIIKQKNFNSSLKMIVSQLMGQSIYKNVY